MRLEELVKIYNKIQAVYYLEITNAGYFMKKKANNDIIEFRSWGKIISKCKFKYNLSNTLLKHLEKIYDVSDEVIQ